LKVEIQTTSIDEGCGIDFFQERKAETRLKRLSGPIISPPTDFPEIVSKSSILPSCGMSFSVAFSVDSSLMGQFL
jgi:hypothetical protein